MATTTTTPPAAKRPYGVIVFLVLAGALWASSLWWWPLARGYFSAGANAPEEKKEDHGHSETGTLTLSNEARETLGIETGVLQPTTYERVIPVPGRAIVVPGIGRQQITAGASGMVAKVFVTQGELVSPGQTLFEIQLVHDEAIDTQVQLLDALADKEVVQAEVERLTTLEARTPGAVPGTRLLEKRYELRHLNHVIASRRQMLVLLGLPQDDVDRLIQSHIERSERAPDEKHEDYRHRHLLDTIVIKAPLAMGGDGQSRLLLEKLSIVVGQHVDSGDVLCQLGDYRTLWIEGEAFERDLETIRAARDNAWPVTVAVERRGQKPLLLKDLKIRDLAPQVDAAAGSAGFYVELPNELRAIPSGDAETERIDWVYRPGQRVEIRVPAQLITGALKVPVAAVAEDGLNHYVFQVSGNTFVRRPVQILERDENFVVIAQNRFVQPGVKIALNGAFQLQLALLNKAMDPAALAHGHSHG
jgi:multidrug efflux pump subunit AcrA (membrane-fusion protein)